MQVITSDPAGNYSSSPRSWWARLDVALLALLSLPLCLLGFDYNYFVTKHGNIDPWVYFGYFLNLRGYLQTFPSTYYGTRLSVIIPGRLAYKMLPDVAANYVLHMGLYLTGLVCLYLLLKDLVHRRAAFLAALLLGCFSSFILAVSWDYVDGYGIVYCLLAYALLNAATRSRRRWLWLPAGGAAAAAMAVANSFYAIHIPFLIGFYLVAERDRQRRSLALGVGWIAVGAALLVLALGCFNRWLGGQFWFFLPSLSAGYKLVQKVNPWATPLREWLPIASWLYLPVTVGAASLVQALWWLARPATRPGRTRFYLHVQLIGQLLLFAALEATGHASGPPGRLLCRSVIARDIPRPWRPSERYGCSGQAVRAGLRHGSLPVLRINRIPHATPRAAPGIRSATDARSAPGGLPGASGEPHAVACYTPRLCHGGATCRVELPGSRCASAPGQFALFRRAPRGAK